MNKDVQAYIAYTAAQITANWNETVLWDKDRSESVQVGEQSLDFQVQKYPFKENCDGNKSRDGMNHCLVDGTGKQHICLSVYGNLFDGYSQDDACHYSGMVYDNAVELYDYNESDFFRFEKV